MDTANLRLLARLLREQRTAALGTLRDGAPYVSMVAFVAAPDLSCLHIHISRLAPHTRSVLNDPRVALMIAETDAPPRDPQTLARLSIQGTAEEIPRGAPELEGVRARYLARFPDAAQTMALGDFSFFRISPANARLVAGLGRTFNLGTTQFRQAAAIDSAASALRTDRA